MKEKILLRLTRELKSKLKQKADKKGMPLTSLIVSVLWEYVE